MTPILELRHLTYSYPDGKEALHDVSFSLQPGECIGVIGPNGSGKSTLLLHLNGVLPEEPRSEPVISLNGKPVGTDGLNELRRNVGLLFQDPDDQLFCATVYEDVAFGPVQFGWSKEKVAQAVSGALGATGLLGFEDRSPHHLSGGEKQRVCLAGILSCEPQVLALDEPTSDLDPRGRRELKEILRTIPAAKVIATHDLELVVDLCPRTILLDGGRIIADAPTVELLSNEELMLAHGLEKPHVLQHRHPH